MQSAGPPFLTPSLKKNHQNSKTAKKTTPSRPLTPMRKWAFRLIALFLLPALLCVLELALRLGGYGHSTALFKPIKIGGEDYLVQNDDFSLRFFPKETARNPGVLRMKAHKPPGTIRIFILGESAAMGDPEPAYGAGRYMEALLRDKFSGMNFEIVNVAFTAINSHVILPIAKECVRHDGDIWIVYMGNNEMVGPFGAATVFGAQAPPRFYAQLVTRIQATRVGQLLVECMRKITASKPKSSSWAGMQMFLENRIAPQSPKKEVVYRNFEKNLNDILSAGLEQHSKIILNTVAVNLKDTPPFASISSSNLSAPDQAIGNNAAKMESSGDFAQAAALYARAAALDDKSAELQYGWGHSLLKTGDVSQARAHLQLACDDDALPFRADSRTNGIIRHAANKFAGEKLMLLDSAMSLTTNNPSGLCGDETFYEHVHFDFDGSYHLAMAWAHEVEKLLPANAAHGNGAWASQEMCEQWLGLSDWNRSLVIEHLMGRLQVPPFNSQPNNAERLEKLRQRVAHLHAQMNTNTAPLARSNFLVQLKRWPEDFILRENFALFLQATGDLAESVAQWRQVHDMVPHDYLPYFQLGRLLGGLNQWTEAETDLRAALKIHPSLSEGWYELGNVLASQEKYSEALNYYAVARQQRPQDGQTVLRMGKVHARLNQHDVAAKLYQEAIDLNPTEWEPHYELAAELDAGGKLEGALKQFGEAARLNAGYSRTHYNYGVLLAKAGHLDEAQREFEESLRLEPGYKNAADNLMKIQILKQRQQKN